MKRYSISTKKEDETEIMVPFVYASKAEMAEEYNMSPNLYLCYWLVEASFFYHACYRAHIPTWLHIE